MTEQDLTYAQLLFAFHPRPIRTQEQYQLTQNRIDALIDKEYLTRDEKDYMSVLGMMIERYEDDNEEDYSLTGLSLAKAAVVHYWYEWQLSRKQGT